MRTLVWPSRVIGGRLTSELLLRSHCCPEPCNPHKRCGLAMIRKKTTHLIEESLEVALLFIPSLTRLAGSFRQLETAFRFYLSSHRLNQASQTLETRVAESRGETQDSTRLPRDETRGLNLCWEWCRALNFIDRMANRPFRWISQHV